MNKIILYCRTHVDDKSEGYIWVKFYVGDEKINASIKLNALKKIGMIILEK